MEYDDMLDRAIAETPDIEATGTRFEVPTPDVRQEGNVTVFENFQDVSSTLDRDPEHVIKSLQNELGTSGHIDESGRARLTGSFDGDRIADALEAYVADFVRCSECGLPDTQLETAQGATVLRCDACGAQSPTGS